MEKFNEYVVPYLENGYMSHGIAKSMLVEYFQKTFIKIAATELPHIGRHYLFYQNKEAPELVMRFRITQHAGLSATIMLYGEYENYYSIIGSL